MQHAGVSRLHTPVQVGGRVGVKLTPWGVQGQGLLQLKRAGVLRRGLRAYRKVTSSIGPSVLEVSCKSR